MGLRCRNAFVVALLWAAAAAGRWADNANAYVLYQKGPDDGPEGVKTLSERRQTAQRCKKAGGQGPTRPNLAFELKDEGFEDPDLLTFLTQNYVPNERPLEALLPFSFERLSGVKGDLYELGQPLPAGEPDYPKRAIGGVDLDNYKWFKEWLAQVTDTTTVLFPQVAKVAQLKQKAGKGDPTAASEYTAALQTLFETQTTYADVAGLRRGARDAGTTLRERLSNTHSNLKEFLYFYGNLDEFIEFAKQGIFGEVKLSLFPQFAELKAVWTQLTVLTVQAFSHTLRVAEVLMGVLGKEVPRGKREEVLEVLAALAEEQPLLTFYADRVDEMDSAHQRIDLELDRLMLTLEEITFGRTTVRDERREYRRTRHYKAPGK